MISELVSYLARGVVKQSDAVQVTVIGERLPVTGGGG